jgi:branched-chain amino acid transport system ATP-binding protein
VVSRQKAESSEQQKILRPGALKANVFLPTACCLLPSAYCFRLALKRMTPTILEVIGLYKFFGGLAAVAGVDFHLEKGEILGLIGPNGSGKTTVFNLIAGVFKPDRGSIKLAGQDITGAGSAAVCQMGIGRTFQIPLPFSRLTVLENVRLGRVYGSQPAESIKQAEMEADEILEFIGLKAKQSVLSGSLPLLDRKRLELGKALATRPKVLLLDEILGGLTPAEIDTAMKLILAIRNSGVTLVVVEHVMRAIMGISDRVIVLNSGAKIAEGPPKKVVHDRNVIEAYLGVDHHANG